MRNYSSHIRMTVRNFQNGKVYQEESIQNWLPATRVYLPVVFC